MTSRPSKPPANPLEKNAENGNYPIDMAKILAMKDRQLREANIQRATLGNFKHPSCQIRKTRQTINDFLQWFEQETKKPTHALADPSAYFDWQHRMNAHLNNDTRWRVALFLQIRLKQFIQLRRSLKFYDCLLRHYRRQDNQKIVRYRWHIEQHKCRMDEASENLLHRFDAQYQFFSQSTVALLEAFSQWFQTESIKPLPEQRIKAYRQWQKKLYQAMMQEVNFSYFTWPERLSKAWQMWRKKYHP